MNMKRWDVAVIGLAVAVLAVQGCTVGPNYGEPQSRTYDEWGELLPSGAATGPATKPSPRPPVLQWWRTFGDPQLDALVDRAMKSNLDLRRAQARGIEARGPRGVGNAGLFSKGDTRGPYTHSPAPSGAVGAGAPPGG